MHVSDQLKSFTYYGSKFSYLQWLLPLLPECKSFVDTFGGSAAVIINRKPSDIETFNDINGRIVNLFEVLRVRGQELIDALYLTPYSRGEYKGAWDDDGVDPIERARRFFIRTQQSMWAAGAQEEMKGWASSVNDSRVQVSEKVRKWRNSIEGLPAVIERFRAIQIECKDFRYIMQKYDTPETLFYLDSPYHKTFRSSTNYEFDFKDQDFHDLHHYASRVKGKVAISGYNDPFMLQLFRDFEFTKGPERQTARKSNTDQKKQDRYKQEVCECLWTNYKP